MAYYMMPHQMQGVAAVIYQESMGATDRRQPGAGTSASGRANIQDLHVGSTRYPLYAALPLETGWDGVHWVCWSPSLGLDCSGRATSPVGAREEWGRQVHATFQRLYAKRPVHMTPDETALWYRIGAIVNVAAYRDMTPLALREIGQVRFGRLPYPHKIEWIYGREDIIRLENGPPELAGFKPGQWIEADVLRDHRSGQLLRIDHVQRIKSPPPLRQPTAIEKQWQDLPVADLPDSDWDEFAG
jgi:hypothetical protein